jgi:hypothetical protein
MPGLIAFTRMLRGPNSLASDRVTASTAALVALYADVLADALRPDREATSRHRPNQRAALVSPGTLDSQRMPTTLLLPVSSAWSLTAAHERASSLSAG